MNDLSSWVNSVLKLNSNGGRVDIIPVNQLKMPSMLFRSIVKSKNYFCFEDLYYNYMSLNGMIGAISFKSGGNCFANGGIYWKDSIGCVCNSLHKYVMCFQNVIYDFEGGYNGITIVDYMNMLYKYNKYIRIDYTLSAFCSYERDVIDGGITGKMCDKLKTHNGMSKDEFQNILG